METLEPRRLLAAAAGGVSKGFNGTVFRPASDKKPSIIQSAKPRTIKGQAPAAYTNYFATRKNANTPFATPSPTGLSPTQVRNAYGINGITFGSVTGDGAGQTIAIINAYDHPNFHSSGTAGYATSDLFYFNQQFGLPQFGTPGGPTFTKIDQTGGTNYPAPNAQWAAEIALDVEWAHAIAPKADIVLVEASDNAAQIDVALNYARNLPGVSAISMSYGAPEYPEQTLENGNYLTPAGHGGVTFLAATGDTGANGSLFPAYSPNVVAVGGTTFSFANGNIVGETGWSGSGGGISQYEAQPEYQTGVVPQSSTQRTAPDVSFVAGSGVSVYDSYNNGSATPWWTLAGTSLSTPCWAGLVAITNQGRALVGLGSLNGRTQTLPRLYRLSGTNYNDITDGNNGYDAVAGYDLVTGRGTPKAASLVNQLAGGLYTGVAYIDANGSGTYAAGETLLNGVTVYNDSNNNAVLDAGEASSVTVAGVYSFDLAGGEALRLRVTGTGQNFPLFDAITGTTQYGTFTNNLPLFPSVFTSTTGYRIKASGTKTQIYTNSAGTGTPLQVEQSLVTTGLTFNGASSSDLFVIDATAGNPLPSIASAFVAASGTDTLQVISPAGGTTASYSNDAIKIGTSGFGLNSLTHSDVENLTFTGGAGNDTVNLVSGGQQPVYTGNGGNDVINVTNRPFSPTYNLGGDGTSVTVNASGNAVVTFTSNQTLAALNLVGSSDVLMPDSGDVLRTKNLSIDTANGGFIDLGVNALLLDWTGTSKLTTIRNYITAGYASGAFTGPGLRPNTANPAKQLGYGEASHILAFSGGVASYLGQTIDNSTIIVRTTWLGDADLDGTVSILDFNRFSPAFGTPTNLWTSGDFDYDGGVSILDFNNLSANFGQA